jgi:adenylylsulfate kinase-like enzyme
MSTVYWITGLSGCGKTTLAEALRAKLTQAVLVDGDAVRELMGLEGFDRESRLAVAYFNAKLCRFLAAQGLDVICSTISLFHEVQAWNRKYIPGYCEIFLDVPMEILEARDPKNIYKRARAGELHHVVGIHIPAEIPNKPEFTFTSDGSVNVDTMVQAILTTRKRSKHA